MKCLITGSNGFTGKHLSKCLTDSWFDVIGCDVDILQYESLKYFIMDKQPDCVVHLAAQSFVHNSDVSNIYNTNIVGTANLLKAVFETTPGIKSILLASSATIYGNSDGYPSESSAVKPSSDYAVSKLAMENMASLWFDRLPIFIVRPFNYTGVGQASCFLVPKIVEHFLKKEKTIELGNIDVFREFQDVRTIVDIYRHFLTIPPIHKTINICNGVSYSLKSIIQICEEITGHKIEIKVNPKFVRQNEILDLKGDPSYLHSLLPNKHAHTLEDTLRWMLSKTPSCTII